MDDPGKHYCGLLREGARHFLWCGRVAALVAGFTITIAQLALHADGVGGTRARFEALASQSTSLDAMLFIGGDYRNAQDPNVKAIAAVVADPQVSVQELAELLGHADPKVRTLALLALFDREDPQLLPQIAVLMSDKATTFFHSRGYEQTVGRIAEQAIQLYLGLAGYQDAWDPKAAFEEYWAARQNRVFCTSWFRVQLYRAQKHKDNAVRLKAIQTVHNKINALPPVDRAMTLLWVMSKGEGVWRDPPADFVQVCQDLGPDRLLLVLQRRIPSDDPDLSPQRDWERYRRVVSTILQSAKWVLRKEDAPTLVALELKEREFIQEARRREARAREELEKLSERLERREAAGKEIGQADLDKADALAKQAYDRVVGTVTTEWVLAAAELDPKHAEGWLSDALKRFKGSEAAHLAAASLRVVGPSQLDSVVDQFYAKGADGYDYRHLLLRTIGRHEAPQGVDRTLIGRLIQDPRFETIDPYSLSILIEKVNNFVGLSDRMIDRALVAELAKISSTSSDPQATQLLRTCREQLRASLKWWFPSGPSERIALPVSSAPPNYQGTANQ